MRSSIRQKVRAMALAGLALLAVAAAATAQERVTRHANGQVATVTPMVDGKAQGVYREFDDKGVLLAETPHVNGQRHGLATLYYGPKKPQSQIPYNQGKVDGTELRFYRSGALHAEVPQRGSRAHGIYKEYYDVKEPAVAVGTKGVLHFEIPHVNGQRHGLATSYYDNGNPVSQIPYNQGQVDGTELKFHRSGALFAEVPQRGGRAHGIYKEYYDVKEPAVAVGTKGVLHFEIPHVDGQRHGLATSYYDNGNPLSQIPYNQGQVDGTELKFHRSGALFAEVPQRGGQAHGIYKEYYDIPGFSRENTPTAPKTPTAAGPKLRFLRPNGEAFDPAASDTGEFHVEADIPLVAAASNGASPRGVMHWAIVHANGARAGRALSFFDNGRPHSEAWFDAQGQCGAARELDRDGKVTSAVQHRPCTGLQNDLPSAATLRAEGTSQPPASRIASFLVEGRARLVELDENGQAHTLADGATTRGSIRLSLVSGTLYRSKRLRFEWDAPAAAN